MTATDTAPPASAGTRIYLSGDIDIFTTERLRQRLVKALRSSTALMVLDMSHVTFCGAGGLGVLLGVQARGRTRGVTLALTGISPSMTRLLRAAGLERRFPIMA
ncbi:STAS domain-containing protein [Nonomuraea sp. NBC_01738]|uniref:STAS domain-containing protein n=1 Tax=Nonomuraea sp. NBC_01738 TaxID=2976003 RepID=UPI002E16291A|nr:STAS domain-containing protein [Nonomuraea sp. NBC_01738]